MQRLRNLASHMSPAAAGVAAGDDETVTVALLSHDGGPHVTAYLEGLAATEAVGRVLLVVPDGAWVDEATDRLGSKLAAVYTNVDEMLAEEVPIMALVAYEAVLAPPIVATLLRGGCHVMAEKPSSVSSADIHKLTAIADSENKLLMLALANRLLPEAVEAKRLIEAGAIGKIFGVEAHMVADQTRLTRPGYGERWEASKARAGGGHLVWLGIHWLDLMMYITDSAITHVAGFTATVGEDAQGDVEDSAAAALRFDNGTLGTITSGYYTDAGYNSHIKIWGSKGWIHLEPHGPESEDEFPMRYYSHAADDPEPGKVIRFHVPPQPEAGGYTGWVRACVAAVMGLSSPPISNADSAR